MTDTKIDTKQLNGTLVEAQKNIAALSEQLQENVTAIQADESFEAGAAVADELLGAISALGRSSARIDVAIKSTEPMDTGATALGTNTETNTDVSEEETQE